MVLGMVGSRTGPRGEEEDVQEVEVEEDEEEEDCAATADAWAFCMLSSCRRAESGCDGDGVARGWARPSRRRSSASACLGAPAREQFKGAQGR